MPDDIRTEQALERAVMYATVVRDSVNSDGMREQAAADVQILEAALHAQRSHGGGESVRQRGWQWVPADPSTGMLVAGNHGQPGDFSALKVWQDMLAAATRSGELGYLRPIDPPTTTHQGGDGADAQRKARELVADIKAACRSRPTAVNGYNLKLWDQIEEKLRAALAARSAKGEGNG